MNINVLFQRLKDGGVHQHQGGRWERRPGADDLGQSCPVLLHRARVLRGPREHLEVSLSLSAERRRWDDCVAWQGCDALRDAWQRIHMTHEAPGTSVTRLMSGEAIWSWLKWKLGMSRSGNQCVTITEMKEINSSLQGNVCVLSYWVTVQQRSTIRNSFQKVWPPTQNLTSRRRWQKMKVWLRVKRYVFKLWHLKVAFTSGLGSLKTSFCSDACPKCLNPGKDKILMRVLSLDVYHPPTFHNKRWSSVFKISITAKLCVRLLNFKIMYYSIFDD